MFEEITEPQLDNQSGNYFKRSFPDIPYLSNKKNFEGLELFLAGCYVKSLDNLPKASLEKTKNKLELTVYSDMKEEELDKADANVVKYLEILKNCRDEEKNSKLKYLHIFIDNNDMDLDYHPVIIRMIPTGSTEPFQVKDFVYLKCIEMNDKKDNFLEDYKRDDCFTTEQSGVWYLGKYGNQGKIYLNFFKYSL